MTKKRLTPQQKKALRAYEFAERQEDRYLSSVFANPFGAKEYREKVTAAYDECIRLGMTHEHGL